MVGTTGTDLIATTPGRPSEGSQWRALVAAGILTMLTLVTAATFITGLALTALGQAPEWWLVLASNTYAPPAFLLGVVSAGVCFARARGNKWWQAVGGGVAAVAIMAGAYGLLTAASTLDMPY